MRNDAVPGSYLTFTLGSATLKWAFAHVTEQQVLITRDKRPAGRDVMRPHGLVAMHFVGRFFIMQNYYEDHQLWQAQLTEEERELRKLLKIVRKELSHAPEGSLSIAKQGGRTWYRRRFPGQAGATYIKHSETSLICRLAQKRYDTLLCGAIELELKQLQAGKLLAFQNLAAVYDGLPELWKPFVEPHVLPDDMFIEQWLADHQSTASGDSFKSKSERIHAMTYRELQVPFVYEPALHLDGYGTVRPDFVVLNVRTRRTFYHEHFGIMDDPGYCAKALAKLNDYHRNGYYEGKNLIITMESSLHPMDPDEVADLFRHYLL